MTQHPGSVIVGAGLAAAHTAATLREHGYDAPITLIGTEQERPYERPALSKAYLQGSAAQDTVYVHDAGWYADHQVDTRFGETVTAIDRAARTVRLGCGQDVAYDRLVLATGASPRSLPVPGAELEGVHTLRTLADSTSLRARLSGTGRWVVIGGGWIGLEVAAAARGAGRDVTVLEASRLPLQRVLGDRLGQHFADLHRANGVDLRTGTSVTAIEQTDGALAVRTGDGLVPADVVVMAVGAAPDIGLASEAGLTVGNGIVVDQQLRTADPTILAVGDVANAHNTALGQLLRVEHWDNAIRQGRLAARTILGLPGAYDWQPYFYTDQFDLGMEYVGHGGPGDRVVVRGEMSSGEFIAFWLDGDKVTAAMNVNTWDVNDDLRALIGRTIPAEKLTDTGLALTDL